MKFIKQEESSRILNTSKKNIIINKINNKRISRSKNTKSKIIIALIIIAIIQFILLLYFCFLKKIIKTPIQFNNIMEIISKTITMKKFWKNLI